MCSCLLQSKAYLQQCAFHTEAAPVLKPKMQFNQHTWVWFNKVLVNANNQEE